MKKLFFIFALLLGVSATFAFTQNRDKLTTVSELPAAGQTFLNTHFKDYKVLTVQSKWYSYEIILDKGMEVKLDKKGNWEQIESNLKEGLPQSVLNLLPQNASNYISQNFAEWQVVDMEKKKYGYKVELENGSSDIDLKFTTEGELLKVDY